MSTKYLTPRKLSRIKASTRIFTQVSKALYLVIACAFGLLILATAAPHKREHATLQKQLQKTLKREEMILARKEHKEIQLQALRTDNTYLELLARDRLNYYKEGERILRFDRAR